MTGDGPFTRRDLVQGTAIGIDWNGDGKIFGRDEHITRREIESLDTREAIRQIFGEMDSWPCGLDAPTTSGPVEQQSWFAKLRGR